MTSKLSKSLKIPEKDWLQTVVELAQVLGWEAHHVFEQQHYARRIGPGFPDLVLVRPPRVLFAEVKSDSGKLTADQEHWKELLEQCPGVQYWLWRPGDWEEVKLALGVKDD